MRRTVKPPGTSPFVGPPNIAFHLTSPLAQRPRMLMRRRHTGMTTLRHWHCPPTDCPSLQDQMRVRATGFMGAPRRLRTQSTRQPPFFGFPVGRPSNPSHCSPFLTSSRGARRPSLRTRMPPARLLSHQSRRHRAARLPMFLAVASSPQPRQEHHQGMA